MSKHRLRVDGVKGIPLAKKSSPEISFTLLSSVSVITKKIGCLRKKNHSKQKQNKN